MTVCSVCNKKLSDLETFGPVSYPLCWDHWWDYVQGELYPEKEEEKTGQESTGAGQLGFI